MNDAANQTPAGWFPDPLGRHEHRYFNGHAWTADVADSGQRMVDPFGSAPGPSTGRSGSTGFGPPGGSGGSNGSGGTTAALVCGIIAVVIAWIPFLVVGGIVLAVLALVFGIRGVRRVPAGAPGRGKATTGIVTGAVALGLSAVGVWLTVITLIEVTDFIEPARHDARVTVCSVERSVFTVDGTLTNRSSGPAEFTVFAEISIPPADGDDRPSRSVVPVEIESLDAGETTDWQAVGTSRTGAESCNALVDVYGPFPFGLEMDRP